MVEETIPNQEITMEALLKGGQRLPINSTETHVTFDGEENEILTDQAGGFYFMWGTKAVYFTVVTVSHQSNQLAEVQVAYKNNVPPSDRVKLTGTPDTIGYLRSVWDTDRIEYTEDMVMILLNIAKDVLGWVKLSQGGTIGTVCDPKVVFSVALVANANSIILAHNHPSGNLRPSEQDILVCRKINEGAKLLDIKLLDNIIITANGYYSFASEGML